MFNASSIVVGAGPTALPAPSLLVRPRRVSLRQTRCSVAERETPSMTNMLWGLLFGADDSTAASAEPNHDPKTSRPSPSPPPSMAQTYMRGPLTANGSGKALTKQELDACKAELEELKKAHGFSEPVRSHMDDPDIEWLYHGPPDYSLTNLQYLKGRTKQHAEGSLEQVVENLVKTWEMERSHKVNPDQHQTVDLERFNVAANGWERYDNNEANRIGNYNVLMSGCPANLWDKENTTWDESHEKFHDAFAAFPWEVLEVFSGPPTVAFSWRHWAHFTGEYEGHKGNGELVEMFGFGVATVNENLQICDLDIYYKPNEFLEVMKGMRPASDLSQAKTVMGPGCPFLAMGK